MAGCVFSRSTSTWCRSWRFRATVPRVLPPIRRPSHTHQRDYTDMGTRDESHVGAVDRGEAEIYLWAPHPASRATSMAILRVIPFRQYRPVEVQASVGFGDLRPWSAAVTRCLGHRLRVRGWQGHPCALPTPELFSPDARKLGPPPTDASATGPTNEGKHHAGSSTTDPRNRHRDCRRPHADHPRPGPTGRPRAERWWRLRTRPRLDGAEPSLALDRLRGDQRAHLRPRHPSVTLGLKHTPIWRSLVRRDLIPPTPGAKDHRLQHRVWSFGGRGTRREGRPRLCDHA